MSQENLALRNIHRGWSVIPLHWIENGECSCGDHNCSSAAKHPITNHGVKDASLDERKVRDWWQKWPRANVGIVTGATSGIVVMDFDRRHGGLRSLRQLKRENGELPAGPQVRTGGGGTHSYFSHPGGHIKNKIDILPGVDVRADQGYIVAPGGQHQSGNRYQWKWGKTPEKIPPPPLPDWLLNLIENPVRSRLEATSLISEGCRNSTLTSLAGTMHRRGMSHEAIEAALLEDNSRRCNPPLPDDEVCGIARSISSRYAPGDPKILSATPKEYGAKERKPLVFLNGEEIEAETSAEVRWLVAPWVALGALTEIDGKVKLAGKTTFVTHMARAVLDGRKFLGESTKKTKIVYLTEQPLTSFRIAMERAKLLGRRDFKVLFWAKAMKTPWRSIAQEAVEMCMSIGARLLVVDTLPQFARLIGDTENNAGDALKALRPLQEAADKGIAVVIVRHERKSGGPVGDSGRGSSAFAGAVDIIISLRRPDGNPSPTVRLIQAVSRFDTPDDLLIDFTDGGYVALGAPGEAAKERAANDVLSSIPKSRKNATTIEDLVKATKKKRAYLQRCLDGLEERQRISKIGKGRKGSPFRYFQE